MKEVVVVGGVRTAIGDYMGSLSGLTPVQLGVTVLKAAIAKAGLTAIGAEGLAGRRAVTLAELLDG